MLDYDLGCSGWNYGNIPEKEDGLHFLSYKRN